MERDFARTKILPVGFKVLAARGAASRDTEFFSFW